MVEELRLPEETVSQKIGRAIKKGAPLFNSGDKKGCFDTYLETARLVQQEDMLDLEEAGLLSVAVEKAESLENQQQDYVEGAWVLRRCFDKILKIEAIRAKRAARERLLHMANAVENVVEVADRKHLLKTYSNCFVGKDAVTKLVDSGVATSRKDAVAILVSLAKAGFVEHVTKDHGFEDAKLFYRFNPEAKKGLEEEASQRHVAEATSARSVPVEVKATESEPSEEPQPENQPTAEEANDQEESQAISEEEVVPVVLDTTNDDAPPEQEDVPKAAQVTDEEEEEDAPASGLTLESEEEEQQALEELALKMEGFVDIKDRKHLLKTYEQCFVGKDAVTKLVDSGISTTRMEAARMMEDLRRAGYIEHVTNEHDFQDAKLFYRFTRNKGASKRSVVSARSVPSSIVSEEAPVSEKAAPASTEKLSENASLPEVAAIVSRTVDIADRKHRLKTYKQCFVGKDAVTKLVELDFFVNRTEATKKMVELREAGFIEHVTGEHTFEDAALFYRFTTEGLSSVRGFGNDV